MEAGGSAPVRSSLLCFLGVSPMPWVRGGSVLQVGEAVCNDVCSASQMRKYKTEAVSSCQFDDNLYSGVG